jgi:hypothetical protein
LNLVLIFLLTFFLFQNCNDIKKPKLESIFLSTLIYNGATTEKIGIISSDFSSTGKFNLLNPDINFSISTFLNIHSDAVGKFMNGKVYILNRLNRDSVLVLNPANAFLPEKEFSVGRGTNPYDIIQTGNKAYISLYNEKFIPIYNLDSGQEISRIDLSNFLETVSNGASPDSLPESSYMFLDGNSIYVFLQRLDRNDPVLSLSPNSDSIMIEIDMRSDKIISSYILPSRNPISKIKKLVIEQDEYIAVACPNRQGFISKLDGGIIAFNLRTKKFRQSFLLSEQEAGGDILDFVVKNETEGYAYTSDLKFNKSVFGFNPSNGKRKSSLVNFSNQAGFISGIALSKNGKLYIGDGSFARPGISIFDTTKSEPQRLSPIPVEINLRPTDIFVLE